MRDLDIISGLLEKNLFETVKYLGLTNVINGQPLMVKNIKMVTMKIHCYHKKL